MDSDVLEYNVVSLVTVRLKHQEPLSEHSFTFLKTQILNNKAVRISNLMCLILLTGRVT